MLFTVNFLLKCLIVAIVSSSEVQSSGKIRRDEDPLHNDALDNSNPPAIDNESIQQVAPLNDVKLNENVQLITPSEALQPESIQEDVSSKPMLPNEENVQQIVPDDPSLQEIEADIPNADGETAEPNVKLHGSKKAKVAAHKIHQAQEKTGAKWPMGVVPYAIDTDIYDAPTIQRIVQAMSIVESSSCVLFRELRKKPSGRTSNAWLYITNPRQERECVHETTSDETGKITVVLAIECLHPDEILRSILKAIGFKDEVSHPHRDQYIRIMWENIQPQYRHLFRIQYEDAPYKLVEYDPLSIMHFHDRAFSVNGAATIAPRIPGLQIGGSGSPRTLSQLDVMKLKLAFGHECNKRKIGDLLDTCKKALIPKILNDHHGPTDKSREDSSHRGSGASHVEEEVEEQAVQNDEAPDEALLLNEADAGDSHQDQQELRKGNAVKNKKQKSKRSKNKKVPHNLRSNLNKTAEVNKSQRRGRYSYYRRG